MNILKIIIAIMIFVIIPIIYIFKIQNDHLALILLFSSVLYIVFGWLNRCESNTVNTHLQTGECIIGQDKLHSGIFFGGCFDIWHVSHFLLWVLLGLLSPNHFIVAFILSFCWEGYEDFKFKGNNSCDSFYCGRIEDIVLNMLGYFVGSYMVYKRDQFNKKQNFYLL